MTRTELLLTQLAEEACEVAQEASKCLRFGPLEVYPDIGISNAERVISELNDLMSVVNMLIADGVLSGERLMDIEAMEKKSQKVERLLVYSAECGQLTEAK